jgi:2-polyprenyl-6-methoxyphenol hydroxylase-like FAD-dependent oxidoreductase
LSKRARRSRCILKRWPSFLGPLKSSTWLVRAILDHKGEWTQFTAAFVVGCDGAHSAVRHLLNLPFEGAQYDASFMLVDIETSKTLRADEMQLCPSEFGPLAIFPISATRRRIVATVEKTEEDAPSLDLVRRTLAQRAPAGIEMRSMHWSSYFWAPMPPLPDRRPNERVGSLRLFS